MPAHAPTPLLNTTAAKITMATGHVSTVAQSDSSVYIVAGTGLGLALVFVIILLAIVLFDKTN